MIELMRGYAGHLSGMRFDSAVINLEEVKTSSNGKSFLFLVVTSELNVINGDPIYRFSHYIENSILTLSFSEKTDIEIATEIITLLS